MAGPPPLSFSDDTYWTLTLCQRWTWLACQSLDLSKKKKIVLSRASRKGSCGGECRWVPKKSGKGNQSQSRATAGGSGAQRCGHEQVCMDPARGTEQRAELSPAGFWQAESPSPLHLPPNPQAIFWILSPLFVSVLFPFLLLRQWK